MRKLIIPILLVFVVLLVSGCVQKPTVTISDGKIIDLSLSSATLDLTVIVHNPNPIGSTFSKIEYDIYYKDDRPLVGSRKYEYMGHSVDEKRVIIETSDTTIHTFLTVKNRAVLQALMTIAIKGKVWIKVKGTAYLDVEVTSFSIPFDQEILVVLPR